MKLISLNIWGANLYKVLYPFLEKQKSSTDIFCFQEILSSSSDKTWSGGFRVNCLEEIKELLPEHDVFFSVYLKGHNLRGYTDFDFNMGLATFIKKDLKIVKKDEVFIYEDSPEIKNNDIKTMPKKLQYVQITNGKTDYHIINLHGLWYPGEKEDTDERIKQSEIIKKFSDSKNGKKIITGDFNLMPYTKSMEILDDNLENLIKKYKIKTTRFRKYQKHKPYQYFADYILVSPDIKVLDFKVLETEVSDHKAMSLEFE